MINILVVEDSDEKRRAVCEFIERELGNSNNFNIQMASAMGDAVQAASSIKFDLIILDLMLPYILDGQASSSAGLEILRRIRAAGMPNEQSALVGLSAFPDEIGASRAEFERFAVLICTFDESGAWMSAISRRLSEVKAAADATISLDFLIFAALEEEVRGFDSTEVEWLQSKVIGGLNLQYLRIPGEEPLKGAVVRLRNMGLVSAAVDTSIALSLMRPKVVAMSGICAGFSKNAKLGQVIVASPAWEYQAGKWSTNGFEFAIDQIPLPPVTKAKIAQAISEKSFLEEIESKLDRQWKRPLEFKAPAIAPTATGSAVVADGKRLKPIIQQHRKVAALDMETFGVYYAVHECAERVEHFFSAKCIVDLADAAKSDDLHSYGCAVAARCTVKILRSLLTSADAVTDLSEVEG